MNDNYIENRNSSFPQRSYSPDELDTIDLFKHVIAKYSKTDILFVIKSIINNGGKGPAGPLLAILMNGIMAVSKLIYGKRRKEDSDKSFIMFLTNHMDMGNDLATHLHDFIRHGIAHDDVTKYGIEFFVDYDTTYFSDSSNITFEQMQSYFAGVKNSQCITVDRGVDGEKCLKVDVSFLAYCYLTAIDRIDNKNTDELIGFFEVTLDIDAQKEKSKDFLRNKAIGKCLYSGMR